jgi:hypothetical protein
MRYVGMVEGARGNVKGLMTPSDIASNGSKGQVLSLEAVSGGDKDIFGLAGYYEKCLVLGLQPAPAGAPCRPSGGGDGKYRANSQSLFEHGRFVGSVVGIEYPRAPGCLPRNAKTRNTSAQSLPVAGPPSVSGK